MINKKLWFLYMILNIITLGIFSCYLAKKLNCYSSDAWYSNSKYWIFGTICLIFPVFIMAIIFIIETNVLVAKKLNVPGSEIYNLPYTWIGCFIVPILGWSLFIIMLIYVYIWQAVKIGQGEYAN